MLVCRFNSAALVFAAGNLTIQASTDSRYSDSASKPSPQSPEGSLYYYRFDLTSSHSNITHQFALSAIPLDFPTLHPNLLASEARYIYGCSSSASTFSEALGKATHIDVLAKVDTTVLINRAKDSPPTSITGCVDTRSVTDVLSGPDIPEDPIRLFRMPPGWYAQEGRFVPRQNAKSEDDGYLLFYAFDESQLDRSGDAPDSAFSELWVLDAKTMRDVVCRITLPQRVPYGLHGCWFPKEEVENQRAVESFRRLPDVKSKEEMGWWDSLRTMIIRGLG